MVFCEQWLFSPLMSVRMQQPMQQLQPQVSLQPSRLPLLPPLLAPPLSLGQPSLQLCLHNRHSLLLLQPRLLPLLLPLLRPQAGLAVNAAMVPNQLSSSWGGAPGLRDVTGKDQHTWAR